MEDMLWTGWARLAAILRELLGERRAVGDVTDTERDRRRLLEDVIETGDRENCMVAVGALWPGQGRDEEIRKDARPPL
jgi:hypothetical protein